jgi:hypothetical protein
VYTNTISFFSFSYYWQRVPYDDDIDDDEKEDTND